MKRFNTLLLIGLISLAIFIIPDLSSMFMGEHNYYDQVSCKRCHVTEYDEVNGSVIGQSHINAANNTNYTTYLAVGGIEYYPSNSTIHAVDDKIWTWNGSTWINTTSILVKLDKNNNALIDGNEVCQLCHNASLTGELDAHAITVRTCDDDWCHGNKNNTFNDPELLNSQQTTVNVGTVLNESGNLHRSFYISLYNESTGYTVAGSSFNHTTGNRAGNYISKGYWACISCHSEVQVEITIIPGEFNHTDGERRKYL